VHEQLKSLTTFGDENGLMENPSTIPSGLSFEAYCNEDDFSPDLLRTESALSGIYLPTSISEWKMMIYDNLSLLKDVATNSVQLKAAASISISIVSGRFGVSKYFLLDIATGNVRRWLVVSIPMESTWLEILLIVEIASSALYLWKKWHVRSGSEMDGGYGVRMRMRNDK
jgi:hypothetical protein